LGLGRLRVIRLRIAKTAISDTGNRKRAWVAVPAVRELTGHFLLLKSRGTGERLEGFVFVV
jgi:hypothetical protein